MAESWSPGAAFYLHCHMLYVRMASSCTGRSSSDIPCRQARVRVLGGPYSLYNNKTFISDADSKGDVLSYVKRMGIRWSFTVTMVVVWGYLCYCIYIWIGVKVNKRNKICVWQNSRIKLPLNARAQAINGKIWHKRQIKYTRCCSSAHYAWDRNLTGPSTFSWTSLLQSITVIFALAHFGFHAHCLLLIDISKIADHVCLPFSFFFLELVLISEPMHTCCREVFSITEVQM